MKSRHGIVHILFHPVSAKRFVEPLVEASIADGTEAELWVQPVRGTEAFLASLKVPAKICPSNLELNPLKNIVAFFTLWTRLRQRRPLVLYAHLLRGAFLPLLAARLAFVPVRVYHNHGAPYIAYRGFLRAALMGMEWANCRLATHIATDSAGMRPALEALARKGMPVATFGPGSPCGLDESEYAASADPQLKRQARRAWNIGEGDLVLLYVGRPHRRKGFPLTLDAFQHLFAKRHDVHLLVCGCSTVDVKAVLPVPPKNIRALGYLEDLRPVYQVADAILLPSFHEGFGNSLLEGAAQGCALLASRIPGPDILVEDGQNGFLVEPESLNDLMRAMKQMDLDRETLRAMGAAAYQKSLLFRRAIVVGAYLAFMRDSMALADSRFRAKGAGDRLAA
jgi:glycosyltransferase involved in cell wall biosynthesis